MVLTIIIDLILIHNVFSLVLISKFYFAINTSERKLYKAWKITKLLNLNINLYIKKNKMVKS